MTVLSNAQESTQRVEKNEEKEEYIPNKKQDKMSEKELTEMEISDLPDNEFKIRITKILRRRLDEKSQNLKGDRK